MARNEECSGDPVLAEQLENAANALRPELAARIMLGDFAANVPIHTE
jgi:hypothetical protein